MNQRRSSRNVTPMDLLLTSVVLLVFLVPLTLLTVFPDATGVRLVLGEGRVFIWWGVIAVAVMTNRRRIDEFFERWERRRHAPK
jgi:hypothetical protein